MKALFIIGPTAVGKTNLAFRIHQKIPSILISADSIQVYRTADIISGKDTTYPTELLSVVSPNQPFSVRDFVQRVISLVKRANIEHKIPIIVGGTGFYVDALFGKIETMLVPPNKNLRIRLDKLSVEELQERLKGANPERLKSMNNSDVNNKRRLIRAIEVAGSKDKTLEPVFGEDEVLIIGLKTSMDSLRKKIVKRVENRIALGALKEAEAMFENYTKLSPQLKNSNGYKEMFDYLSGRTDFEEAKQRWINADYHHAKDQMTWFRKRRNIQWFDIDEKGFENKIFQLVKTGT